MHSTAGPEGSWLASVWNGKRTPALHFSHRLYLSDFSELLPTFFSRSFGLDVGCQAIFVQYKLDFQVEAGGKSMLFAHSSRDSHCT